MDKISICLQNKEIIAELAKDKDVQLRIKDAIIDGISKRAVKLLNANAEIKSVVSTVASAIRSEIHKNLFAKNGWRDVRREEYKKEIAAFVRSEIKSEIRNEIKDEMQAVREEILREIISWKNACKSKIENADLETIIREEADNVLRKRLKGI